MHNTPIRGFGGRVSPGAIKSTFDFLQTDLTAANCFDLVSAQIYQGGVNLPPGFPTDEALKASYVTAGMQALRWIITVGVVPLTSVTRADGWTVPIVPDPRCVAIYCTMSKNGNVVFTGEMNTDDSLRVMQKGKAIDVWASTRHAPNGHGVITTALTRLCNHRMYNKVVYNTSCLVEGQRASFLVASQAEKTTEDAPSLAGSQEAKDHAMKLKIHSAAKQRKLVADEHAKDWGKQAAFHADVSHVVLPDDYLLAPDRKPFSIERPASSVDSLIKANSELRARVCEAFNVPPTLLEGKTGNSAGVQQQSHERILARTSGTARKEVETFLQWAQLIMDCEKECSKGDKRAKKVKSNGARGRSCHDEADTHQGSDTEDTHEDDDEHEIDRVNELSSGKLLTLPGIVTISNDELLSLVNDGVCDLEEVDDIIRTRIGLPERTQHSRSRCKRPRDRGGKAATETRKHDPASLADDKAKADDNRASDIKE